ncbi:MAG: MBL fold metallo-hydrolase [Deltaproteobacteria bacterium]|nr:MBL fold metallo-hydrolase [Deltaproteobacteria bacterium]
MKRFRNLDDLEHERSIQGVLRWQLERAQQKRLIGTPASVVDNDGSLLKGAPKASLTWLGHASWLVQIAQTSVMIDPVLFARIALTVQRHAGPGLTLAQLPTIDAVLITHNHMDHMDAPSVMALAKQCPWATFVVPEGLRPWFVRHGIERSVELPWWSSTKVGGVKIQAVPSQHWSRRGLLDEDRTHWCGYVIEGDGRRVYHTGDTAYFTGFSQIAARVGAIDAAMLPIGAYEPRWFMRSQHMNPDDAVRAFEDLRATRFVAMHWGTFMLTDEPLDEPPKALARAWKSHGITQANPEIPAIGETLWL